jgi:hypothetical protein
MTYKKIPLALSVAADVDRIEKTAGYYSDGKFFLEIYKNGTCVFPPVSMENKAESGDKLLAALNERPVDFTVKEMDDHNFVVQFSNSVFAIVFADEFVEHRDEISQQAASLSGDEVVMGRPGAPEEHMLIGLYARTRLLEDIHVSVLMRKAVPVTSRK